VSTALTAPFLAAGGVLCVSGVAKLRSPRAAVAALALLRLPARAWLVRTIAVLELSLGAIALAAPGRVVALVVAGAYAGFVFVALRLVSLRAACGCFGESDAPASPVQAALSVVVAGAAAAAAVWPPGGLGWVLGRPVSVALTLALGLGGCIYGLVIAYTQLPRAWAAWEAR
jgi:methylamine utilization protein MauE